MSCFEDENNIIGLSKNDCPCYDTDRPADYDDSLSGLYLDELVRLEDVKKLEDCSDDSLWNLMKESIEEAVEFVQEDIVNCIKERSKLGKESCTDVIGGKKNTKIINPNTTYAGWRLRLGNIKGACSLLRNIKTIFEGTGVISASIIFNGIDLEPIDIDLDTTANVVTNNLLTDSILMHHFTEECDEIEVYVIYEVDPTNLPKDNVMDCGCSGKYYCHEEYIDVDPIAGDDISLIEDWRVQRYAMGLLLDMSFRCKEENTICDGQIDWKGGLGRNIARAIQYKSAFLLFEKIYYSHKPSVWTVVSKDDLEVKLPKLDGKYDDYIAKACMEVDLDNTDCFVCRNGFDLKHRSLA